jgi:hypothetical protein
LQRAFTSADSLMPESLSCLEMSSLSVWVVRLIPIARAVRTDAGTGLTCMGSHCTFGWVLSPQVMNQTPEGSSESGSTRKDLDLSQDFIVNHLLSSLTCLPGSASEELPYNRHFNTGWVPLRCCQSEKSHLT